MWVARGDAIVEVTNCWNGKMLDGSMIDLPTARRVAP